MVDVNVEINYDKKMAKVSCPEKTKAEFTISRAPGGFIFYEIATTHGELHNDLQGKFSGLDVAVKFLTKHIQDMKQTHGARSEELAKDRAKRKETKNAKDDAKGS